MVVIALRCLFQKTPKWMICLLWAVVAAELVSPVQIASPLSVRDMASQATPVRIEYREQVNQPELSVDFFVPAVPQTRGQSDSTRSQAELSVLPLRNLWLAGAAGMLLYAAFSALRLRRQVAAAIPVEKGVWICDEIDTPFILGLLRPHIYLPSDLGEAEQRFVLSHERAHLHRRDHWWKLLGYGTLSIYWFHPLVWVAYALVCRDIEMACDERVCRSLLPSERKNYALALLSLSASKSVAIANPLGFGEIGVKERVMNVKKYRKPTMIVTAAAAIMVLLVAVAFGTTGQTKAIIGAKDTVGSAFEADLSVYDKILAEHPNDYYAFADMAEHYDVLMLSDSAFDNLDGTFVSVAATVYGLDGAGNPVEIGNVEAGGSATPLAASQGHLYCGGNKVMFKLHVDEASGTIVYDEGVMVSYNTEGTASYFTGTDPEKMEEPSDEATYDQLFNEYYDATPINFTPVTEPEPAAPDADQYSVATSLDKETVEAYAAQVRETILNQDWETLSGMLDYPMEMNDGSQLQDADAFLAYMDGKEVSEAFLKAVGSESCVDMFANDQGICLQDGEAWIAQRGDEPAPELKVIALNGIVG